MTLNKSELNPYYKSTKMNEANLIATTGNSGVRRHVVEIVPTEDIVQEKSTSRFLKGWQNVSSLNGSSKERKGMTHKWIKNFLVKVRKTQSNRANGSSLY